MSVQKNNSKNNLKNSEQNIDKEKTKEKIPLGQKFINESNEKNLDKLKLKKIENNNFLNSNKNIHNLNTLKLNINKFYKNKSPNNFNSNNTSINNPQSKYFTNNIKNNFILRNPNDIKNNLYLSTEPENKDSFLGNIPNNNNINFLNEKNLFNRLKKSSSILSNILKPNNLNHSNNSFSKNKKNYLNTSAAKNNTTENSNSKDFVEEFFDGIEKYTANLDNIQLLNKNKTNIINILDNIFKKIMTGERPSESIEHEIKKKLSKFSEIWKKFLIAYEKMSNISKNPNFINNINLSTKNVINNNAGDSFFMDEMKKNYKNFKFEFEDKINNMQNEMNKTKNSLEEKEKFIEELQNQIFIKDTYIIEMEENLHNFKIKNNSHSILVSENHSMYDKTGTNINSPNKLDNTSNMPNNSNNELFLYDQKQFIREKKLLINENLTLCEKINEMDTIINLQKDKEIKLMKLLFYLNKQGIPIDDIIQNEINCEKSLMDDNNLKPLESSKSLDSSIFLPLTLDKPFAFIKPDHIPILNLKNINSQYNLEYGSPKVALNYQSSFTDPNYNNKSQTNNNKKNNNNILIQNISNVDTDVKTDNLVILLILINQIFYFSEYS